MAVTPTVFPLNKTLTLLARLATKLRGNIFLVHVKIRASIVSHCGLAEAMGVFTRFLRACSSRLERETRLPISFSGACGLRQSHAAGSHRHRKRHAHIAPDPQQPKVIASRVGMFSAGFTFIRIWKSPHTQCDCRDHFPTSVRFCAVCADRPWQ